MKKIAAIEIKNNKFFIAPVLDFFDSLARAHVDLEFSRYSRMRYVLGEMLERRIERAYPGKEGTLDVEFYLSDTMFEVSVKDMGVPAWDDFSYDKDAGIQDEKNLRNYVLSQWMDEIGMEKLGKNGQRIYLRQRIKNPIHFKAPEPYPEIEVLDTNITIKQVVTEDDVMEAIRCIYNEYGYTYGYERLYYKDSFLEAIRNKEIMSFLAVNEHGQTAGHYALAFSDHFKNMPEMSTAVIRKEFRGLRLFQRFVEHAVQMAEKHQLRAIMAQPVAYHLKTQTALLREGFTATSLLMAYVKASMAGEFGKENKSLDLCTCVRIFDKDAKSVIYPPTELKELIQKQYDRLGWQYEMSEDKGISAETELHVEDNNLFHMKKMVLKEASEDVEVLLNEMVDDAIRRKHEMIELMIVLNSPSCEHGYQIAKKCGFVISGVIPGGENGDYLMMQKLLGDNFTYDQLVTAGEFEELKNDIIALNK